MAAHNRIEPGIAIFLLVVCDALSAGAGALKGVVKEHELGGPTLANVPVSAPGASPTKTDQYGQFTLIFPNKKVGEAVTVSVSRAGYVVVNDLQLEQVLPADPDAKPLVILISPPAKREEMALRFYRLAGGEAIDANFQRQMKQLQEQLKQLLDQGTEKSEQVASLQSQIVLLERERDEAKAQAEKLAEQLAQAQPGQMSEMYQRALRLFLDERIEEALGVLNEDLLRQKLAAARKEKEEADKAIDQAAQSWVLRARLLALQFKFAEATKEYQTALEAAPDSYDVNFAYAYFSQSLNRYAEAREVYAHCLEVARRARKQAEIAETLNNLGVLESDQNRMEQARLEYQEALKIRRKLAAHNPDTYLPDVAETLNNLGVLDRDQNRIEQARGEYGEALKIRRELAAHNPDTFLSDVAETLNNLGVLDSNQNRMEQARLEFEEALKIRRELAAKNPDAYLPYVAGVLNNLGNLNRDQNRMEQARLEFEEALKIRRELAARNPDTYLPDVAGTLNNVGLVDRDQNRMEQARLEFHEALKTYRELAVKNPDTYLPYVATTLNNLGLLDRDQNRMEQARLEFHEALEIYRRFAAINPEQYSGDVARVEILIGTLAATK